MRFQIRGVPSNETFEQRPRNQIRKRSQSLAIRAWSINTKLGSDLCSSHRFYCVNGGFARFQQVGQALFHNALSTESHRPPQRCPGAGTPFFMKHGLTLKTSNRLIPSAGRAKLVAGK
jgi:hypothetical protein